MAVHGGMGDDTTGRVLSSSAATCHAYLEFPVLSAFLTRRF